MEQIIGLLYLFHIIGISESFHLFPKTNTIIQHKITTRKKSNYITNYNVQYNGDSRLYSSTGDTTCSSIDIYDANNDIGDAIAKKNIQFLPLNQVTGKLHEIINNETCNQHYSSDIIIATEGYITHRRIFGSSLAFIDLVQSGGDKNPNHNNGSSNDSISLQALLKKQEYQNNQDENNNKFTSSFKSIIKSLYPGTKVYIQGKASATNNPGEVVLLVTTLKFIGLSSNPEHVKGMLQRLHFKSEILVNDGDCILDSSKEVDGLIMEDVIQAFKGMVDINSLRQVLMGNMNYMGSLIISKEESLQLSTTSSTSSAIEYDKIHDTDNNVEEWNSKRISYAKVARMIINQVHPFDTNYPNDILESKGFSKRKLNKDICRKDDGTDTLRSWQYPTLPKAGEDINNVPLIVQNRLMKKENSNNHGDDSLIPKCIEDLLKEQEERMSHHGEQFLQSCTITGMVQNRRRFQGEKNSITVLEVVDEKGQDENTQQRLKCILHSSCMISDFHLEVDNSYICSECFGHLMAKGSRVELKGYIITKDNGKGSRTEFWITEARLLRLSWRPNVVRYFLESLKDKTDHVKPEEEAKSYTNFPFNLDDIANALDIPNGSQGALELIFYCKKENRTKRQWRAAEISKKLQDYTSRMGVVTDEMKNIIEKYSNLREKFSLQCEDETDDNELSNVSQHHISNRDNNIIAPPIPQRGKSDRLLRMSLEGSRWQRAKRPQLKWMTNQIFMVVTSHPDFGKRPLNILDIGGGRGHLANYLASKFGDNLVNVHVLDIDSRTVRNGRLEAEQKSLNVQYNVGDASKLLFDKSMKIDVDIVVALHACGVLTDVALAHAVINQAAVVITPCCFRSNNHLQVTIPKLDEKRNFHHVSMTQSAWLCLDEQELDQIKLAAELQGDIETSGLAIHTLCALRAQAFLDNHSLAEDLDVQLKQFPVSFSTRNYCIVGSFK